MEIIRMIIYVGYVDIQLDRDVGSLRDSIFIIVYLYLVIL